MADSFWRSYLPVSHSAARAGSLDEAIERIRAAIDHHAVLANDRRFRESRRRYAAAEVASLERHLEKLEGLRHG